MRIRITIDVEPAATIASVTGPAPGLRDGWRTTEQEQDAPQGVRFAGKLPGLQRKQGDAK